MTEEEKDVEILDLRSQLINEKSRAERLRDERTKLSQFAARLVQQLSTNECTRGHVEHSVRLLSLDAKEGKKAALEAIVTFGFENAGVPGLRIDLPVFRRIDNGSVFAAKSIGPRPEYANCQMCKAKMPVIPPVIEVTSELQDYALSLYLMAKSQQGTHREVAAPATGSQLSADEAQPIRKEARPTRPSPLRLV